MTTLQEVLNNDQQELTLFCRDQAYVGIGLSGTWTGFVNFFSAVDGVQFMPCMTFPFPWGTPVENININGNFFVPAINLQAVKVKFLRLTGSVTVKMGSSLDGSFQDAYLASTSRFIAQEVSGGLANTITVAAQANRAWRCRTLVVGFSTAPSTPSKITISDGASSILWETFVPVGVTGGIGNFVVPLPADRQPGVFGSITGGVVGTPGNSMVISLAAPGGSVVSSLSAEMVPA
jgi:hypothetical protein